MAAYRGYSKSVGLLISDADFNHLVMVVSTRTLHCKVIFFFLIVTNKNFVERYFEIMQISYFSS